MSDDKYPANMFIRHSNDLPFGDVIRYRIGDGEWQDVEPAAAIAHTFPCGWDERDAIV